MRVAKVAVATLLALAATSSSLTPQAIAGFSNPYAQPGRLVRLPDGRAINLVCVGRGSPTVVFESGFGAGASAWGQVQPLVAGETRACSYDRAGYGFSTAGPMPRTGEAIARDLDMALRRADERGPFVLVGHSAGGLYARLFAARRPADIAGLVLVDTSVPFQDRRLAQIFGPGSGSLDGVRQRPAACAKAAQTGSKAELEAFSCLSGIADTDGARAGMLASWKTQVSELDTLFTTTSAQVNRTGDLLKSVPTIVLTASPTGLAAGREDPAAMVWQAFHREIAAKFFRGEQRIVKSSHLMMTEQPEAVAKAVLDLVHKGRRANPSKLPVGPRG